MMRKLLQLYEARSREIWSILAPVALLSVAIHAGVIGAWVRATLPSMAMDPNSIANHIFYIPPPDRVMTVVGTGPALRFSPSNAPGEGVSPGDATHQAGSLHPMAKGPVGNVGKDSTTAPATAPSVGRDSVFSVLDVDTAVVRSSSSAAPAYPLKMLHAGISGHVQVEYIVDTTGFADTTSFVVLVATNNAFADAVRDVLPYMRFNPAKIGPDKVRQRVRQTFSFKITDSSLISRAASPAAASPKKP